MDIQSIKAYLLDDNPEAVLFDEFDCALIGGGSIGTSPAVAVYSQNRIMKKLAEDGFSPDMAKDFFDSLVAKEFGDNTPVVLRDLME